MAMGGEMSTTPRTDEYMTRAFAGTYNEFLDLSNFARQLERELAEARAERDKWNKAWKIATGHLVNEEKESEYQLQRAEKAEAECERLREDAEMKLPCGVTLDRGTHIGKGCSMSTLVLALKNRARYEEEDSIDAARNP
jgi:lipid II:glycine glycyltransferase (peptidoglycan interpeptide bridge formation enzyme)